MKRVIIPGPPGTGKTYHLTNHYLRKELEEYKTPSNKIAYITFSNAAADEAKERIGAMFPKFDVKRFSICFYNAHIRNKTIKHRY